VFSKLFNEGLQIPIIPSLEVVGKKRGSIWVNSRIAFVKTVMVILPS